MREGKRAGTLADCIREAVSLNMTGEILHQDGVRLRACIIFVSGEPAGAEYTDAAGTIYGDTAVLRLPVDFAYTLSPLPIAEAEALAGRARIFHPMRLFAHAKTGQEPEKRNSERTGIGTLTVRIGDGAEDRAGLRIELWKNGRICASDTTDQHASVSFRLLEGTYECRVRDGVTVISKTSILFPGGDRETRITTGGNQR
ncbi:MAG: hypothetical protein Q7J09_01550 [Methanocalculus sp.]|uniref:hypothetical protein n=1 Tax=Methanocalculus sp. TaxID=2004547 RepID=UPI002726D60B|nr:hypothetical protein [Methanocalculus sp.]MDO9538678.1 hypothetical protein [Methanocalculus sp.]